jgi:hypothetical protein
MSDHKRRINKLEQDAGGGDELPWLSLKQSYDDPDIYHDGAGNAYQGDEIDALGERYRVILINYIDDWRGVEDNGIKLTWPED